MTVNPVNPVNHLITTHLQAGAHDDLRALGQGDGAQGLDLAGLVGGADGQAGAPALAARAGVAAGQLGEDTRWLGEARSTSAGD